MTVLTNRFSKDRPVSCAQGRHGELIVVQGNDVRPARWLGSGQAVDAGMDPPTAAPELTLDSVPKYYVARVDVNKSGACYYSPPPITFQPQSAVLPALHRPAKAQAFLSQAAVSEAAVLDGGKYYPDPPAVLLGDTHGKGAVIEALLDAPADTDPKNSRRTGLTAWDIVQQPSPSATTRFAAGATGDTLIPINGNGTTVLRGNIWYRNSDPTSGYTCGFSGVSGIYGYSQGLSVTVSGWKSGAGAMLRVGWSGATFISACSSTVTVATPFYNGASQPTDASARTFGAGYSDDTKVTVTIAPVSGDLSQKIVLEGMTNGNPDNAGGERYAVKDLVIKNGGSGYIVTPQIKITSNTGFGAYATCTVKNGTIDTVTLENSGGGYASAPKVEVLSGGAEAFAVSRPHLRGVYQCYYRYVDDTPEDRGGPVPSNLSPVTEIDAGEGASSVAWVVPAPSQFRATKIELWRTTSNQATTLYRVASLSVGSYTTPPITQTLAISPPAPTPAEPEADGGVTEDWNSGLAYGNGLYVTCCWGRNGVQTSPDGITWTRRSLPEGVAAGQVAFGGGRFVVVPSSGRGAASSTDGITWTAHSMPEEVLLAGLGGGVAYGNGRFVVTSTYWVQGFSVSLDGMNWQWSPPPFRGAWGRQSNVLAFGNGVFASPDTGASSDGSVWAGTRPVLSGYFNDVFGFAQSIAFGGGAFVALLAPPNVFSATAAYARSTDGLSWGIMSLPYSSAERRCIAFGGGKWLVAGKYGKGDATPGPLLSSTDGITWTPVARAPDNDPRPTREIYGMAYMGNSRFLLVGRSFGETRADWSEIVTV